MLAYTAVWMAVFVAMQGGNLYGLDGGSLWHVLVTPGAARADVRGRQAAWLAIITPLCVLAAVIGPLATGKQSAYPWVAGLVPVLLGSAAGLIVLQSAYLPFAMPEQRGQNPFSTSSNPGCTRALTALAYLLLLAPAALPVVAVVLTGQLAHISWLRWLGAPVGLAVGGTLAWWWGRIAYRRLDTRGPEILAKVRARA